MATITEDKRAKWGSLGELVDSKVEYLYSLPLGKAVIVDEANSSSVSSRVSVLKKRGKYKDIRVTIIRGVAYLYRDENS